MKNTYQIIILIVVAIGVGIGIYLFGIDTGNEEIVNLTVGKTNTAIIDLNSTSANEVLVDPNPQGTIETNYSAVNAASTNLGKLDIYVTDPVNVNLPEQAQANKNKNNNKETNENDNTNEGSNQNKNKNSNINKAKGNKVELSSLILTFSKIQVHLAQLEKSLTNTNVNNSNVNLNTNANTNQEIKGNDKWEVLNIDTTKEIDLIALKNAGGSIAGLGITDLAAGKYTQIRMYVSSAKAITADGEDITVEIPGQNNIVKIVRNFTVEAGKTTELTIDFDAISSVKLAGEKYILRPVVGKMMVNGKEVN